MKQYGKFLLFLCSVLLMLGSTGSVTLKAAQDDANKNPYASGLAVIPQDNQGMAYESWWIESELNIIVKNVPVKIQKGTCEITAYIPAGTLKDGSYAVEVFLETWDNGSTNACSKFYINSGVLKYEGYENTGCTFQRFSEGDMIVFTLAYDLKEATGDYQFLLKLHSDTTGKNGAIYFKDVRVSEENEDTTVVSFSEEELQIEAKKALNDAKVSVRSEKSTGLRTVSVQKKMIVNEGDVLELPSGRLETGMSYKSSDEEVAVISQDGILTAKKEGKTTITVVDDNNDIFSSWTLNVLKKDIPKLFSNGLAVTPYHNNGAAYSDWWNESEICAYVENIELGIIRGGYGVSAYIPDYELKDGTYGIEVSLCNERNPYSFFSYTGCKITIRNGILDESESSGVFRRIPGGYLVDMALGYVQPEIIYDYVFVVKIHSSVSGENGSIYFGDLFFADASLGFQVIDLENPDLVISAERLSTKEPLTVDVKKLSDTLTVTGIDGPLYTGEKKVLTVQSNTENVKLLYQSSDEKVAAVSEDGIITAKSAGEAIISVKDTANGAERSVRITVIEPYIAPQIEKRAILLGNTYQFTGVGYGIDNPEFIWTSSNRLVGTIGTKSGLFQALNVGKTTITMKDTKSGKAYAFEVEVYRVGNSELEKYITIETNGLISSELEQKITKLLYQVYPKVFDYFADGKYDKITCTFTEMDGVAYTTGDREIYVNSAYINSNPLDVDCVTHELIHCAQAYQGGDIWLIEGITDYGRSLFGLYNEEANWSLATYSPGQNYTDSYGVTGGFLNYVVENHNKNMISILNGYLKKGSCPESVWKDNTGYTVDELWELYSKHK
ncbi:MAG: Ig-like domain-containing protein [Lachnospiraceae bacterium]